MTKIAFLWALVLLPFFGISQAPNFFKYQSIARNLAGTTMPNAPIGVRISIHNLIQTGTIVFQETHNLTTNDFGLFSLSIGGGAAVIGTVSAVNWESGAKFIEIEADLTGGTTYESFGVTELLSVPYALYSNESGISGTPILPNGTAIGNTSYWDGSAWVVNNNNIYNAGLNSAVGTNSPLQKMHVNGNINIPRDSSYRIENRRMLSAAGFNNVFVGDSAGQANSLGTNNAFLGKIAGKSNSIGSQNTFLGSETGVENLNGTMNSFIGRRAGLANINGNENTLIGAYAGQSTTDGSHNSFLGVTTGNNNTSGEENTFLGAHAGYFNTLGSYNSFIGNFSGVTNHLGNYNTLVGFESDLALGSLTNAAAYGYGAIVNASNSVIVGNPAVISIGGQVGWSTFSDRRLKTDIQSNSLGLNFIKRLKTVSYFYTSEGQREIRYTGLIAQDVENILNELNSEFSGIVKPQNDKDYYSIRYAEFVTPLIKAVQEQSDQIQGLKVKNTELIERIESLERKIDLLLNN